LWENLANICEIGKIMFGMFTGFSDELNKKLLKTVGLFFSAIFLVQILILEFKNFTQKLFGLLNKIDCSA
jgi:hypothetical protein